MSQNAPTRMKALVIDDDEEVLAFAAEVLNSFAPGFDVATARDFEEAILWLGVFRPDLLMVEPKLCGDRLGAIATALRADYKGRDCRIVALSSGAVSERFGQLGGLGAHAILGKPLQLQELLRTVRSVVGWSSASDARARPEAARRDRLY